nr:actin cytoplasmic [Hymenolepis microstoma]
MSDLSPPIVIDSGTQEWRAGVATSSQPEVRLEPSLENLEGTEVIENGVVLEFRFRQKALSYYTSQPLLAAYSSGYSNCLVVDSGYSYTGILAVKDLYPLAASERVLPLGGRNIDRYLRHLSREKLASYNEADIRHIKTNYCSVVPGYSKSDKRTQKVLVMPDGKKITLGEELSKAPEILFNPSLGGLPDVNPIDQASIRSALSLEENDAYSVLETVVLAGGNTGFPGTPNRMKEGIATRTVPRINKRVIRHRQGTEAVWVGGSIIASTQTYAKVCITKEAYRERGSILAIERWL